MKNEQIVINNVVVGHLKDVSENYNLPVGSWFTFKATKGQPKVSSNVFTSKQNIIDFVTNYHNKKIA